MRISDWSSDVCSSDLYNGNNWSTTINGTTDAYFQVQPWPLQSGRIFNAPEEDAGQAVCIIGGTFSTNLFTCAEPIATRSLVGDVSCAVIWLLPIQGQSGFGGQRADLVIMPPNACRAPLTGHPYY